MILQRAFIVIPPVDSEVPVLELIHVSVIQRTLEMTVHPVSINAVADSKEILLSFALGKCSSDYCFNGGTCIVNFDELECRYF